MQEILQHGLMDQQYAIQNALTDFNYHHQQLDNSNYQALMNNQLSPSQVHYVSIGSNSTLHDIHIINYVELYCGDY